MIGKVNTTLRYYEDELNDDNDLYNLDDDESTIDLFFSRNELTDDVENVKKYNKKFY